MIMTAPLEFGLCVQSIEQCLPFYAESLGLRLVARRQVEASRSHPIAYSGKGYRVVKLQSPFGERLKLLQCLDPDRPRHGPDHYVLARPGQTFLSVLVGDIEAIAKRLEEAGSVFRTDPHIIRWEDDVQVAVVNDPEGNPVELCQFDDVHRYRADLPW
jgi:catechol 2,3-dioxygenase-like lactoylglutathione lyase family enzyme